MLSKVASRTRLPAPLQGIWARVKGSERKSESSPIFHPFGEEKGVKMGLFGESGESFGESSRRLVKVADVW